MKCVTTILHSILQRCYHSRELKEIDTDKDRARKIDDWLCSNSKIVILPRAGPGIAGFDTAVKLKDSLMTIFHRIFVSFLWHLL